MDKIYINAVIKKNRGEDDTQFEYPDAWDSTKIHVVAYEDNPEALGEVEESCVGVVTSETWETIKNDPNIFKITAKQANECGKKWKPRRVKVLNQEKVIIALATPEANRSLEEKKILNPDDPEVGINLSDEFDIKKFNAPGQG